MKLETNLIKTGSNWQFDKKHFRGIPKKSKGVYIVGVLKETEIGEKFCPLYVGTHKSDLAGRIEGHWDKDNTETVRGSLNSFKEIFDLTLSPNEFYKGIEIWNNEWKGRIFRNETNRIPLGETLYLFSSATFGLKKSAKIVFKHRLSQSSVTRPP